MSRSPRLCQIDPGRLPGFGALGFLTGAVKTSAPQAAAAGLTEMTSAPLRGSRRSVQGSAGLGLP